MIKTILISFFIIPISIRVIRNSVIALFLSVVFFTAVTVSLPVSVLGSVSERSSFLQNPKDRLYMKTLPGPVILIVWRVTARAGVTLGHLWRWRRLWRWTVCPGQSLLDPAPLQRYGPARPLARPRLASRPRPARVPSSHPIISTLTPPAPFSPSSPVPGSWARPCVWPPSIPAPFGQSWSNFLTRLVGFWHLTFLV